MAVRAKVRVTGRHETTHITGDGNVQGVIVTMQPVYGTDADPGNKQWSKWTPSGEIRLDITNPDAFKQFVLGKEYFVDFTPAEG